MQVVPDGHRGGGKGVKPPQKGYSLLGGGEGVSLVSPDRVEVDETLIVKKLGSSMSEKGLELVIEVVVEEETLVELVVEEVLVERATNDVGGVGSVGRVGGVGGVGSVGG
jgi:hypothetical protein